MLLNSSIAQNLTMNASDTIQNIIESNQCNTLQTDMHEFTSAEIRISSVISIIVHVPLSLFATIVNGLIFVAMIKYGQMRTPANLILTSMSLSDFFVGSVLQPSIVAIIISNLQGITNCKLQLMTNYFGVLCVCGSYMTIVMFALDRCFAAFYPFIYIKNHIYQMYAISITAAWFMLVAIVSLSYANFLPSKVLNSLMTTLTVFAFLVVIVSYASLYTVIRSQISKISKVAVGIVNPLAGTEIDGTISKYKNQGSPVNSPKSSPDPGACNRQCNEEILDNKEKKIQHKVLVHSENKSNYHPKGKDFVQNKKAVGFVAARTSSNQNSSPNESVFTISIVTEEKGQFVEKATSTKQKQRRRKTKNKNFQQKRSRQLKERIKQYARLNTVAIITVLFLLCYLPITVFNVIKGQILVSRIKGRLALQWLNLILLLNSSINPIIYCIRVEEIRVKVKRVLGEMKDRLFCSEAALQ